MRPHFSVFLLFLRQSAWKVLLLLAIMAGWETVLSLRLMPDLAAYSLTAALALMQSPLTLVNRVAFVVLTFLLLRDGRGKHRSDYTLNRLSISPRAVVLWQGVFNSLVYLLFWGVQSLVLVLFCLLYQRQGGHVGPQTFFLACWENALFHSFLPLEDGFRWLRNLAFFGAMGFTAACSAAQIRRKNNTLAALGLALAWIFAFVQHMGSLGVDIVLTLGVLAWTGLSLYSAFQPGKEEVHETVSA